MNKNLLLLVAFGFLAGLLSPSPVSAAHQKVAPLNAVSSTRYFLPSRPQTALPRAVLVNIETNDKIELPIVVQQYTAVSYPYNTVLQYSVLVPASILNVNEKSKWDSSYSVYGTLRQYWSERFDGTDRYVSVSKYEAKWVLYDYSVSMSNAKIQASCFGDFWDGGVCDRTEIRDFGVPTSGVWYTQTPSWAGRYVLVSCLFCYQEGVSQVILKRGSSTWKLKICVDEGYGC